LDRFPPCAGISLRRRLDHQRAQSLFGRTVAFKHVRTTGALLDHADRERGWSGAVWRAGCVELFSLRHLVRERVFARRLRAFVAASLVVRRMRIDVPALYDPTGRYRYWVGFNPIAVAWTAIGFLICTYAIPTAWIPALLTLLITGVGYLLSVWIMPRGKFAT